MSREFSDFISEKKFLRNVSPRTLEWYESCFNWLSQFPLTDEGLKQFVIAMRSAGLRPVSCNNRIIFANGYLKWLGSPLRVQKLKDEHKVIATYSSNQLMKIIDFKSKTASERRLHTLLLVLIDTGLRLDECLSIDLARIDFDNLLITVMGKGSKERLVPFSFELRKRLWHYMRTLHNGTGLLFPTREGRKLARRNVLRDLNILCRLHLGFQPPARGLHALRHTFAVNYLRNGGSVFHLQKALGHTSLDMSRRYVNLMTEDLQVMQQKVSLLNRLG